MSLLNNTDEKTVLYLSVIHDFFSYSWEIVGNIHSRLRDVRQNPHYLVWQQFTLKQTWDSYCFLLIRILYTHKDKSNHHWSRKTMIWNNVEASVLWDWTFLLHHVCTRMNLWQFESRTHVWKSSWIKLCNYVHMFTVGFWVRHQAHCLPSSSRFFMQVDIQAVTAVEEPVNNVGLAENLSYREKPLSIKVPPKPTAAALLGSIHDSAHLWKSIGGAFPGKPFQMQWKWGISCFHTTLAFILLLHLSVCL